MGVRDIAHLRALQTARAGSNPPFCADASGTGAKENHEKGGPVHGEGVVARSPVGMPRHFTRQFPKRADELTEGGSLYWVIGGVVLVRQRLLEVRAETETDGSKLTALVLDPALVPVEAVPRRAFQGWRYLRPEDAPRDLGHTGNDEQMPEAMRRELAALGLI